MYACLYWHRSAGRADSPFIHSFLRMPYPEADGIRYFLRPGMRRTVPWGHCGGKRPASCRSAAKRPYAHRSHWIALLCALLSCRKSLGACGGQCPPAFHAKKGQPYGCPLGVSVPGRIRAPCSGNPSDGGSGGLQTALPVYFPPASCRPPGRSHGWQPPGQSPSHG